MKRYALALFAAAAFAVGCGSDDFFVNNNNNNQNFTVVPTSFRQIEQLARPGINEALLFTNAFLNTYNAVTPAFIAAARANPAGPEGVAAAPLIGPTGEARVVLGLLVGFLPNPSGITAEQALTAFLPDVMRCDSTLDIPVATTAYNFAANAVGSPVAGRKLTDDVIDITYQVLVGPEVTDSVPYYAPSGEGANTNPAIGHQRLNGQESNFGTATFPFLAPAN